MKLSDYRNLSNAAVALRAQGIEPITGTIKGWVYIPADGWKQRTHTTLNGTPIDSEGNPRVKLGPVVAPGVSRMAGIGLGLGAPNSGDIWQSVNPMDYSLAILPKGGE